MPFQNLKFSLHNEIIGKSFRYVKGENVRWLPEDYIEEIRLIVKDIVDNYGGQKGILACDVLFTDKYDARGTKGTKRLARILKGERKYYDIEMLYNIASYLNKTVATLLFEIELRIASKKPPVS